MKKNILVLGGFGFIGTNLIEELIKTDNYNLLIFELKGSVPQNQELMKYIKIFYGDFTKEQDLEAIFRENEVHQVLHLISATGPGNEDINFEVTSNLLPTVRLLDLMRKYHTKEIVFLSSGGTVYGPSGTGIFKETDPTNPICAYGVMKLAIEKVLQLYYHLYGIEYLILRPSNPFGEYHTSIKQGFINVALKKILQGEKITIWGDGSVIRDYIYVKDLAKIVVQLMERGKKNRIFNIGSGKGHSLKKIVDILKEKVGLFDIEYTKPRKFDVPLMILDISAVKSTLEIVELTPLEDAISKTIIWIRDKKK